MLRNVQTENSHIRSEVRKLEEQLKSLTKATECVQFDKKAVSDLSNEDMLPKVDSQILRHKCKLMQAQLNQLNEDTVQGLPADPDLHYLVLRRHLLEMCRQYRECCAFLTSQKKEIAEDIDRERKVSAELLAVFRAAEMKLEETVNEKFSKAEVLKRLESKCSTADRINKMHSEEMSSFLDENYPLPSQETFSKVKKKLCVEDNDMYGQMRLQELKPLKDIVQELMTLCIENPNDPYILTDRRYWPPYIDLLLMCDIALRHPADCNRIKLMPFHL